MPRDATSPACQSLPSRDGQAFIEPEGGSEGRDRPPWPKAALRVGGLSLLGWMPFVAILVPLFA